MISAAAATASPSPPSSAPASASSPAIRSRRRKGVAAPSGRRPYRSRTAPRIFIRTDARASPAASEHLVVGSHDPSYLGHEVAFADLDVVGGMLHQMIGDFVRPAVALFHSGHSERTGKRVAVVDCRVRDELDERPLDGPVISCPRRFVLEQILVVHAVHSGPVVSGSGCLPTALEPGLSSRF